MSSLNDKLSKLKKKTDLTNLSALDLISRSKVSEPKIQNTNTQQNVLPDIVEQHPTDEFIIPQSVGTVVEQEVSEDTDDLNIKEVGINLNSLKSNIYSILSRRKENEDEVAEDEVTEAKPKKKSSKKITEDTPLEELSVELKNEIGDNEISDDIESIEKEIKTKYKNKTKKDIPDDVNVSEVINEINEIIEDIPSSDDISLTDFEIVNTTSKKGYTKTVVGFKGNTPKELSQIATYARKVSDNLINPRTMNILNIQNINKTQLRDSEVKLPLRSYTFKPDHTKLKVSKFNRFIIGINDDFETKKEVYIYLQESRTKFVTKVECDIEFIGKLIYSFYIEGIEVTKRKIQFKNTQNPLLRLVPDLVKSREFKVKPLKVDDENQTVKALKLKLVTGVNPWLSILIHENKGISGLYDIYATADFDESWKIKINEGFKKEKLPLDIPYLHSEDFMVKLVKFCNNDIAKFKTAGLNIDDKDIKFSMLLNNLKHRNLRNVFIDMLDVVDSDDNVNELEIVKTYSQIETKKISELEKQDDYNAEIIIGKSKDYEYFIITYFAMLIKGGDKRKGRQYITREQYYQKYNVKDKRQYDERVRTILAKGEDERNYNARPYMFKIEYKENGKEKQMVAKTFEEINSKLNIY